MKRENWEPTGIRTGSTRRHELMIAIHATVLSAVIQALAGTSATAQEVTVTIDQSVQHQVILGWGATAPAGFDWQFSQRLREQILDEAVNELGLTRLRLEPPSGNRSNVRRWEWVNDNGDPADINWSAFNTPALDEDVSNWVVPFKERVEANGDPFDIYISPSFFDSGSSGEVPAWLRYSPGEYAEFAIALILHLKNEFGISADYYCICNEAGNNNPFTPALVGKMIKALGPKLKALGLSTKIEFPESINANTAWNYIQALRGDAAVWPHIGVLAYHLYGNNTARPDIRDFAMARGLPTGQTEYMGLTLDHLYDDLTLGGVSYWEIYGLGSCIDWDLNNTSFSRVGQYWNFRQVMHYVRPGARRIEAISSDRRVRALAFLHESKMIVVIINRTTARTVTIRSLSPGTYGVSRSVRGRTYEELGVRTVKAGADLTIHVPSNTILTVYTHPGTNQPPTVTDWKAIPNYLTLPRDNITLLASATDPELDTLSYRWSVANSPAGADVVLDSPGAARTRAAGLTVPGEYVFTVAISDAAHTVSREVVLKVFADNQPPIPIDVHNRIPLMVTLPASSTQLRGGAFDLEGDPLRYRWSVVSQPDGASVSLSNPASTKCTASNMRVPGDYIFKFEVSDPTHTVSENLTVTVYPVNTAPVIIGVAASPADLTLPESTTTLSAETSDPDGDVISHWWSAKSYPAGSDPVFSRRGSPSTTVAGLTKPGRYVFTLTVVDRTKFRTRDVTVTVNPPPAKVPGFGVY